MRKIWKSYVDGYNNGIQPQWIQDYVGTKYRPQHNTRVEAIICIAQFFGSAFIVFFWILKSYDPPENKYATFPYEVLCVILCLLNMFFERIHRAFSWRHALNLTVVLDCLTLPPILMQTSGVWAGGNWLTLAYLRVYQVYKPMARLVELNYFDNFLSNFIQECILSTLECLVVVFAIAGTFFVLEGLGDIEGFSDSFVDSGMGGISFFQMVYFSFVTISTVSTLTPLPLSLPL